MSGKKCKHCGSSDIEVDPARGDAVCTNCGSVLEDNIIVAEVEFQENAHGGASAIGQFVSADSKGGATGFGRAFNVGIGQESREVTLRKAREGITNLCQQLRLNQQCIDIACNFYKMALSLHLTIGRPSSHTQAACTYMTCRTEGTPHLLIDVSDAAQICCYQLGRTYFKLARALCINIPPNDPCLYILRFASQLQFEDKQHEVSRTALRMVQRMKRDSIHSGRRPTGICGAALLLAGRLHDFNRTPADVVRIVKVHESTLRKRLLEFGDTPSSALTLDEFMTVDLEEEQDPPAFRAARKRDKERLQKLMEEEDGEKELTDLQREIELQIEKDSKRKVPGTPRPMPATPISLGEDADDPDSEEIQATMFVEENTMQIIGQLDECEGMKKEKLKFEKGLGPDLAVIGLGPEKPAEKEFIKPETKPSFAKDLHNAEDLVLGKEDEAYIDSFIMTEEEARHKINTWNRLNAGYLKQQKIKEEIRAKEKEENKNKKKTRGSYRKKVALNAATASEAVGKMLAERKISAKINYDILKSLDMPGAAVPTPRTEPDTANDTQTPVVEETPVTVPELQAPTPTPKKRKKNAPVLPSKKKSREETRPPSPEKEAEPAPPTPSVDVSADEDYYDEDDTPNVAEANEEPSLASLLQNEQEDDYFDDEY